MSTRHPIAIAFPLARSLTLGLLIGSALLSLPPIAARADSLPAQQQLADTKSQAAKDATGIKPETVEQRITSLHDSLKITPAEESKWDAVAQVMRDNAATIDKLVSAKKLTQAEQKMSALDDLMTYQEFAQAHVEGLKHLTAAFKSLYNSMPDDQKKVVDAAFQGYGSRG